MGRRKDLVEGENVLVTKEIAKVVNQLLEK